MPYTVDYIFYLIVYIESPMTLWLSLLKKSHKFISIVQFYASISLEFFRSLIKFSFISLPKITLNHQG